MVTIAKSFTFDSAHCLTTLPEAHKCHNLHGHTYRVTLIVRGPVDEHGFVVDYSVLAAAWQPLHEILDHRFLNDVPGLECPSTEVLAAWIGDRLAGPIPQLIRIRLEESATTWAEVDVIRDGACE